MVKVVEQSLVSLSELDHIFNHDIGGLLCDQYASHEISDHVHFLFAHTISRDFDRAHAQPTGSIPILRGVTGNEILVRHNIGARQQVGRIQAAAERAHRR